MIRPVFPLVSLGSSVATTASPAKLILDILEIILASSCNCRFDGDSRFPNSLNCTYA